MNKVVFLSFSISRNKTKEFDSYSYNPSMGIISLATWMEFNGLEAYVFDLGYLDISFRKLIQKLQEINPIMIGLSLYTENYMMGLKFANNIKQVLPNAKIVLGGPHPSLCPESVICEESVDFVSCNEGECTLLELVEAIGSNQALIKYSQIQGLIYKENNQVIKNNARKKICDLDLLPIPKREYYGIENYTGLVSISTSRGCPGRCIYCSATALSGATYRFRSVGNVVLEMVMLNHQVGPKIQKIYVNDDTFTAVPDRIRDFAAIIKRFNINIPWHCESRVDVLNEELIELLAESRCVMIQFGIESGSQTVLDKIHKNISLDHAKKIIQITSDKGIKPCLSFMVGHFCDTLETMDETCEFIKECYEKYHAEMALSYNTPFPGTWQYTHLEELGMRLVTEDFRMFTLSQPLVETENFTVNDQVNCMYKVKQYLMRSHALQEQKEGVRL